MRTLPVLALALSSPLLWAQFDEPMRQHDAHVHGEARGNLSIDADSMQMTLEVPAFNLIGFEHPPADAEQRSLLERVVADLESVAWVDIDPAAGCRTSSVDIDTPGLVAEAQHADHAHHDESHEHDHEEGHDHGDSRDHHQDDQSHSHEHDDHAHDHAHDHGHGSFEVAVAFDCARTSALRWIDVDLFSDYDNNRLIRLDVLSDALVTQVDLVPGRFRVDLAR